MAKQHDMLSKIKKSWEQFKASQPGRRFQERYQRRQTATHGRWTGGKLLNIIAGLAVAGLGLVLIPAPGPGSLTIFFGIGLIAGEFYPIARAADWAEVMGRGVQRELAGIWRFMPLPVKVVTSIVLFALTVGMAYGGYRLFFG